MADWGEYRSHPYDERDGRFLAVSDASSARPLSARSRQGSRSPDGRRLAFRHGHQPDIEPEYEDRNHHGWESDSSDDHGPRDSYGSRIIGSSPRRSFHSGQLPPSSPISEGARPRSSRIQTKDTISMEGRAPSPPGLIPHRQSHRRTKSYNADPGNSLDGEVPDTYRAPSPGRSNRRSPTLRPPLGKHSSTPNGFRRSQDTLRPSLTGGQSRYSYPASMDQAPSPKTHRPDHGRKDKSLEMPGGFPFAPDTVRPDDSRSEPTPSPGGISSWIPWSRRNTSMSSTNQTSRPSISTRLSSEGRGAKLYEYSALQEMEFRLLRILPARMSTIKCEVLHASLDNPPDYVAISYAWGDADDTRKILLEGANFPVGVNLHGALEAIREKNVPVLVWVDAICIDQQNKDERTRQVQLMSYIYGRAASVTIWLGHEADDSQLAVKFLEDVADYADSPQRIEHLISSHVGDPSIPAVASLFERGYWQRLWVVQEVFNAKEITVYCGSSKLPWSVYKSASAVFKRHKSVINYYFPGGGTHDLRDRISQTGFTYAQSLVYQGPSSLPDVAALTGRGEEFLFDVMRTCRRKLCADARDKVFGILGIMPEEIRNEFPVDYNLSLKEVYINVVDYLLSTTECLDVICQAIHFPRHTSMANLPSWVPDWSHVPGATALGRKFDFSASGTSKADCRLLDERRKLELSAVYLDRVSERGIAVGTLTTAADYLMAFIHWRALLLGIIEPQSDDGIATMEEAFCRTLSLDQQPPGWEDPHLWHAACYHIFASLIHERLPHLPLDDDLTRFVNARALGIRPEARSNFLQEHFGGRMIGRCFCMTKNGLMGMGSGFMTLGDVIVVPLGCSTPILIRPQGQRGEYRFVGDVYVHGYMHGRAMDEWKKGKRDMRKYVLH